MKKFIIVGSGTAGLIAATMIKKTWEEKVQVSVIYDSKKKNIGVGESTTPIIHYFIDKYLLGLPDLLRKTNTTIKVGINFKNWIRNKEYFHGFDQIDSEESYNYTSSIYSLINDSYDGGTHFNQAGTFIPSDFYRRLGALHIDTQELSTYIHDLIKDKVDFIDDVVEEVFSDGKNIKGLRCKSIGNIEADYYVDCSGFDAILLKTLNPEWNDISDILPLNRAIPQQVPFNFDEVPSYTLAEATKNGWIWQIPIGNRYGTGYIYSSKFTTDEEARDDYNSWLKNKFNFELETDRVIHYNPGYYTDHWIGNCLAIGLSSGFVEPLESTGIHIIIQQVKYFIEYNSTLKGIEYNRNNCNNNIRLLYKEIIEFICLHYQTSRNDSDFWNYMLSHKNKWVNDFVEKCKNEFLVPLDIEDTKIFWKLESYIQVANGLDLFDKDSIKEFLEWQPDKEEIIENAKSFAEELKRSKNFITKIPHSEFLSNFR